VTATTTRQVVCAWLSRDGLRFLRSVNGPPAYYFSDSHGDTIRLKSAHLSIPGPLGTINIEKVSRWPRWQHRPGRTKSEDVASLAILARAARSWRSEQRAGIAHL